MYVCTTKLQISEISESRENIFFVALGNIPSVQYLLATGLSTAVTSAILFPSVAEMLKEIRRFKKRAKEWMKESTGKDRTKKEV